MDRESDQNDESNPPDLRICRCECQHWTRVEKFASIGSTKVLISLSADHWQLSRTGKTRVFRNNPRPTCRTFCGTQIKALSWTTNLRESRNITITTVFKYNHTYNLFRVTGIINWNGNRNVLTSCVTLRQRSQSGWQIHERVLWYIRRRCPNFRSKVYCSMLDCFLPIVSTVATV